MAAHHYSTLLAYLKQLKREGAEFTGWMPKYEIDGYGEPNGFVTLTVTIKEKKDPRLKE